jgi:predicted patatin/cPLA2 family phospholipase
MEENINFDGLIGVSAGACFGCNYKSHQIGRALRYNLDYCNDKRYCSVHSLIKTGDMYGADFCYHELPEKLDIFDKEAFEANTTEFYLVCTDVETGEPVYHKMDKVTYEELEWMRASASMPLVSRVVEAGGRKMLDGGVSDSIPLKFWQSIGYEKNIVVLTQPRSYRKKKNSLMPLIKVALRKYPKLVEAMARRHEMYNETLDYIWNEEKKGNILVLCPDDNLPIKRTSHDKAELKQVYDMGRTVFDRKYEDIKAFLE